MKKTNKRVTVRLTTELENNLEIISKGLKITRAELIRGILDGWFKQNDDVIEQAYNKLNGYE